MPPKRKRSSPNKQVDGESRMKAPRTEQSSRAVPSFQRVDSSSQRASSSSAIKAHLNTVDAVNFLKKEFLKTKDAEPLHWNQIVEKGKVLDAEAQDLKDSLMTHPRVKVSGITPDFRYSFNPIYDIKDSPSLVKKLRNSGGILWKHLISSVPRAETILTTKRVKDNTVILGFDLPGKTTEKLVVHYQAKVVKIPLDDATKRLWRRTQIPGEHGVDSYQQIVSCMKQSHLSYLQNDIAFDQTPKKLKQLARLVAVSFNSLEEALVVERVIHFECLYKNSLEVLCNFQGNKLALSLDKLVLDRILQAGSFGGNDQKFYFVNYKNLFNLVRYQLDEIRKKVEARQKKDRWPEYYCESCGQEFGHWSELLRSSDEHSSCRTCKSGVKAVTLEYKQTRLGLFIQKMQPLYRLLKEIEQDMEGLKPVTPLMQLLKEIEQDTEGLKPVPRILEPQPANPKRFQRDGNGYLTVKPEEDVRSTDDNLISSGLEGMAVGMPTKNTSKRELPPWFQKRTVAVKNNAVSPTSAANGIPGSEPDDEQRRNSVSSSEASTDSSSASMPPNMTLTENSSYTFASTTSFCLDFYFEVMQNTAQGDIVTKLEAAWQENAALTLKLIFQLRDIRHGKSAKLEFYHCLSWLYKNHFQTLLKNLEHLPLHGYWKDLLWLVHFAITGQVVLVTKQQVAAEKKETEEQQLDYKTVTLEEMIRKRVDGVISREVWVAYLRQLPDKEAKKKADEKIQEMTKKIHAQRQKEVLARHSDQNRNVTNEIANLMEKDEKFSRVYKAIVRIFTNALKHDVDVLDKKEKLESTALAGKWAPSIGCSFDLCTQLGRSIARSLFREKTAGESTKDYDKKAFISYESKYLGPLRDKIDIVEKRKLSEINYERVPSVAMERYKKIFFARDEEHFKGILEAVKKGENKIASGALLPHEIVNEFMKGVQVAKELEDVSEMQWKSYVDNLKKVGMLESALAVCDVSGSMKGDAMNVAIALSLLIAAVSKPPFDGLVCSFSATPQLHAVNQPTLKEKVELTRRMDCEMNINMQAVFNLILNKAIAAKLPANEMVKTIFIFSDMEFDCCGGKQYETDHMLIQRKFSESGYPLPGIVFWNLRGGDRSKPVTKQVKNVAMVSGFSGQMLRAFFENGKFNSPYETMLDTLGKHYDHLEVVD